MASFKVGDRVRRIGWDNGRDGACVGTIATVVKVAEDGFVSVCYPDCCDDEEGFELWHPRYIELFQEPRHDPVTTVTIQDAYLALQEASGIKVGDTVRVLRKAGNEEMGWASEWPSSCMDKYVGETGVVGECNDSCGFRVQFPDGEGWSFPFFVLEKVAPRFITINGFEVPEPVREPLEMGEKYWLVLIAPYQHPSPTLCKDYLWASDDFDRLWLERGLIHRAKEAAEKHAQALLSFTRKEGHRND